MRGRCGISYNAQDSSYRIHDYYSRLRMYQLKQTHKSIFSVSRFSMSIDYDRAECWRPYIFGNEIKGTTFTNNGVIGISFVKEIRILLLDLLLPKHNNKRINSRKHTQTGLFWLGEKKKSKIIPKSRNMFLNKFFIYKDFD